MWRRMTHRQAPDMDVPSWSRSVTADSCRGQEPRWGFCLTLKLGQRSFSERSSIWPPLSQNWKGISSWAPLYFLYRLYCGFIELLVHFLKAISLANAVVSPLTAWKSLHALLLGPRQKAPKKKNYLSPIIHITGKPRLKQTRRLEGKRVVTGSSGGAGSISLSSSSSSLFASCQQTWCQHFVRRTHRS